VPGGGAAGGGGGSGTVTSVSNVDGSITVTGSPTVAPIVSVSTNLALTGTPTAPTAAPGTNSTQLATTAFVATSFAPLASPALTGTPTAPTAAAGTSTTQIATTSFTTTAVNNAIAGVNPAVAVSAATTAAADTSAWTYSNGVGGVGATFTGPVNTAITIDGFTFTAITTQSLLVKNDTQSPSGAFNGVYVLTALQTVGTGAVFTRRLDFDQPSDINNTGAIPVVNGTANGSTTWVVTSTVNTVGTDPITFAQFTLNPSTIAPLASPAFTGTPTAPTAAPGTNTTQLATTAFVAAQQASTNAYYASITYR